MKLVYLLVAGTLAIPLSAATSHAQDRDEEKHPHQKVTMEDLPAPVKDTVKRETKGKTIESMAKEQENGKTVYEIEVSANGKRQEIEISETGKVVERHAIPEEKPEHDEK